MDWPVHEIAPDLEIRITRDMPDLSPALDARIDAHWQAAQAEQNGVLFNGRVFSADIIAPDRVTGHWTEYRRVVAQMREPRLFGELGLRPMAVGGVIVGPGGILFGRRPANSVYQAGQWQLPPAGSIDPGTARPDGSVDYLHQLLTELREELGLPPVAVRNPRPLCIVEHAVDGVGSHVMDLGIAVSTDLDEAALLAAHRSGGNAEYDPLRMVRLTDLPAFIAEAGSRLNRQAPIFLGRLKLI